MPYFEMEVDALGYTKGTLLRNVTLKEAREIECNRCGDCCSGLREGVVKDEATGMPKHTWGSRIPADRYRSRYGEDLIIPIVLGDGEPVAKPGAKFEIAEVAGKRMPYTAFKCAMLIEHDQGPDYVDGDCRTSCKLKAMFPDPDPKKLHQIRPRVCGEFPVFGRSVDATIIDGHSFIPPTGNLPRCSWHGIRVTGPWKETDYWLARWETQQAGGTVLHAPAEDSLAPPLSRRETNDGSRSSLRGKRRAVQRSRKR